MDWRELLSRVRQDDRSILVGAPTLLSLLLLCIGCGPISVALCAGAVTLGYFLADWSTRSNGEFLAPLVLNSLSSNEKSKTGIRGTVVAPIDSPRRERKPWTGLIVPESVNASLEVLIEEMIEQYVNHWYTGGISHDRAFLNEIRYQVRFLASRLLRSLQSIDLSSFILEKLLPPTVLHVRRIIEAEKKCEKQQTVTPSTLESAIAVEMGRDMHYAVRSRQHEADYLRQVVEHVLPHLIDDRRISGRAADDGTPAKRRNTGQSLHHSLTRWPSQPTRHLLRELLTHSVLLPLLDLTADPDTINHLLCLLFDPTPVAASVPVPEENSADKPMTVFLRGLTESASDDLPDSLLQLKLSDILADGESGRLFTMFSMYLSDVGVPLNELRFLVEAKRIHEKMQKKEGASSETNYEVWQIYTAFVHESAPEKISFDSDTVASFHSAVEGNDLERLFRIIEKTYQEVYARMHGEHVVQFCQSETFLGMLCGSPPASLDELEDLLQSENNKNRLDDADQVDKAFTFAQFKNQLFSAIKAVPSEEDEDEDNGSPPEEEIIPEEFRMQACPSIDISYAEDVLSTGRGMTRSSSDLASPASSSCSSLSQLASSNGQPSPSSAMAPDLIIDPEKRDINRWRVTIPTVVPVKDPVNGRYYYAYNIEVQRLDGDESETKSWMIVRRYSEFYVLESKLQEFHSDNLSFPQLPAKKNLLFSAQTREFIDQYRYNFAAFVSGLCKQTLLARSDLLFAFLTSREEFKDSLNFSTLNPVKMVRKMPSKLTREKGQNLKPFVLSLMANALADPVTSNHSCDEERLAIEVTEEDSMSSTDSAPFVLYSSVYGKNLEDVKLPEVQRKEEGDGMSEKKQRKADSWTRSPLDSIILLALPYLSLSIDIFPSGLKSLITRLIIYLLRLCSYRTFNDAIIVLFRRLLDRSLDDASLIACIQLTQQSLFCREDIVVTEQEKALRMELADRRTKQFIEESIPPYMLRLLPLRDLRSLLSNVLHTLQFPCLNKQLTYVLLDIIVDELFPNTVDEPKSD